MAELAKDDLEVLDGVNVLRLGIAREGEWENGEWRYRFETRTMCVVVSFISDEVLRVVTAWRFNP